MGIWGLNQSPKREDAGEITIDELTDIRNYTSFLESGRTLNPQALSPRP